jgi:hypothetical protein
LFANNESTNKSFKAETIDASNCSKPWIINVNNLKTGNDNSIFIQNEIKSLNEEKQKFQSKIQFKFL